MNLLYLDSDLNSIEWMRKCIPFMDLEINKIHYVHSLPDLTTILITSQVDILFTDIVLGEDLILDHLRTIHEDFPDIQLIIYSNLIDFPTVQNAISLGITAYLKKPSSIHEIENALKEAMKKNEKQQFVHSKNQMQEIAFWERFYSSLIDGSIPSDIESINQVINRRGHTLTTSDPFIMILCDIGNWAEISKSYSRVNLEYKLKTMAATILNLSASVEQIFCIPRIEKNYLLIMRLCHNIDTNALKGKTAYLGYKLHSICGADTNWIISEYFEIEELRAKLNLMEINSRKLSYQKVQVFNLEELACSGDKNEINSVSINCLYNYLLSGKDTPLLKETVSYFQRIKKYQPDTYYLREQLCSEYITMVYSIMKIKGINISKLIENEEYMDYRKKATWSINDLLTFIQYSNSLVCSCFREHSESGSKIATVQQYIKNNLVQELNRNILADAIHVNPEYLSRLFKKETGLSLTAYINKQKIKKAKELLGIPSLSISTISTQCGFNSLPYFCKVFHSETGCTPNEYKQAKSR